MLALEGGQRNLAWPISSSFAELATPGPEGCQEEKEEKEDGRAYLKQNKCLHKKMQ